MTRNIPEERSAMVDWHTFAITSKTMPPRDPNDEDDEDDEEDEEDEEENQNDEPPVVRVRGGDKVGHGAPA